METCLSQKKVQELAHLAELNSKMKYSGKVGLLIFLK